MSNFAIYESGVEIVSTPICNAIAIKKILAMVPNPGFNLSGNQIAKTIKEIKTVDSPMFNEEFSETPSDNTVHGAFPNLDSTRTASPIPNKIKPKLKRRVLLNAYGCSKIPHVDLAVHGMFGTNFAALKNLNRELSLESLPILTVRLYQ